MKVKLFTALKAIAIVIGLTLINCFLLVLSFCLPTSRMRQHVADSYPLIESEHQYLQWDQGYTSSMLDFWSEYTLYGAAINEDAEGNAFERAMQMWYIDTQGLDRDKGVERYARYPDEYFELTAYPRYWNGMVMFIKVLLLVFNIHDIRMISMFIHFALLSVIIYLMAKKNMLIELILLITAILFINPISMIYSLVYSSEYIPMILSIIMILMFDNEIGKIQGGWEIFFAIVGSVTSFLCFLSSPFITLGIPLVVMIWCTKETGVVKKVISSTVYWGGAYALTWAMKWIICTMFTSYNLIKNVFERIDIYENVDNAGNSGTNVWERVIINILAYKNHAFMLLFAVSIVLIVITVCIYRNNIAWNKVKIVDVMAGYALIACLPIVIYLVMGNGYAYNHHFMTHRNLAITVLALLCIIYKMSSYIFIGQNIRHE